MFVFDLTTKCIIIVSTNPNPNYCVGKTLTDSFFSVLVQLYRLSLLFKGIFSRDAVKVLL